MPIAIRTARVEDARAIATVINEVVVEGRYTSLRTFTPEEEADFIASMKPREAIFVAEEDGEILGFQGISEFANWSNAMAHVANILTFVRRKHRRLGIGRMLAERTLAFAREHGYEKVSTYIIADNTPAVAFYEDLGFRPVGTWTRQVKLDDGYHDDLIVELFL